MYWNVYKPPLLEKVGLAEGVHVKSDSDRMSLPFSVRGHRPRLGRGWCLHQLLSAATIIYTIVSSLIIN